LGGQPLSNSDRPTAVSRESWTSRPARRRRLPVHPSGVDRAGSSAANTGWPFRSVRMIGPHRSPFGSSESSPRTRSSSDVESTRQHGGWSGRVARIPDAREVPSFGDGQSPRAGARGATTRQERSPRRPPGRSGARGATTRQERSPRSESGVREDTSSHTDSWHRSSDAQDAPSRSYASSAATRGRRQGRHVIRGLGPARWGRGVVRHTEPAFDVPRESTQPRQSTGRATPPAPRTSFTHRRPSREGTASWGRGVVRLQ
jgi:hypothetical protein